MIAMAARQQVQIISECSHSFTYEMNEWNENARILSAFENRLRAGFV